MSASKPHTPLTGAAPTAAPQVLIVAHGQPSAAEPAEAALAEVAAEVQSLLPDTPITSATLAAPGALETAIATLAPGAFVYPLFMADGWFVKVALAKRLDGHNLTVLPPFGMDENLPALATLAILRAVDDAGWQAASTHVLLAAHGSARGQAAAQSARLFADRLGQTLTCAGITVGFIEQVPFLADAAAPLDAPALCLPFFAMSGEHVRDDIPQAMQEAGFEGPVLPSLGQSDGAAALIARALRGALNKRNAA